MGHPSMESVGAVHYACQIHDPYDTVEMARVALTAADLADVGMLNCDGGEPVNLPFWPNMARYARAR
jgi:hypothetical protein